jgi:hypothetical protein
MKCHFSGCRQSFFSGVLLYPAHLDREGNFVDNIVISYNDDQKISSSEVKAFCNRECLKNYQNSNFSLSGRKKTQGARRKVTSDDLQDCDDDF